jgi:hypothetical protein
MAIPNLGMIIKGRLVGVDIEMLKNVVLEAPSQVILGRDVLTHTVMIYDGINGTITMCR